MALPPDSSRPIRWGILGAGNIAATAGADIAALTGQRGGRRRRARPRSGGGGWPASWVPDAPTAPIAELVADPDVDVVYIATTHAQHHEQALLALGAGKPVLVEKAFTLNARAGPRGRRRGAQAGLFCMEAMWMRLQPADPAGGRPRSRRRDRRRDQRARRPVGAVSVRPAHRLFDLAAGGGALLDLGIYPAPSGRGCSSGRPDAFRRSARSPPPARTLTVAQQWGYPGRARSAQICQCTPGRSPMTALVHRHRRLDHHRGAAPPADTAHGASWTTDRGHRGARSQRLRLEVAEVERRLRAGETESPLVPLDDTVRHPRGARRGPAQLGVRYPADEE